MAHIPDKRKTTESIPATAAPYSKRTRISYDDENDGAENTSRPGVERPRNHPVYGQKSAFPGLDIEVEDELFYGPAEDGMEYLRMVRSEANSLPLLFTAPKTPQTTTTTTTTERTIQSHEDGKDKKQSKEDTEHEEDTEGVFYDGVYVAPPTTLTTTTTTTTTEATAATSQKHREPYPEAQLTYYNLLHHRFLLLRSIMKCTPPPAAIAALDDSHPISLPRHSKNARKEWRRLLLAVDPQTVQLACMDMDSVLGVLGIMARLMSENVKNGDVQRVRRIGAWAWGLLGKCRDVGQMGTEEVGEVRDLGKRAVKILGKMREDERSRTSVLVQTQAQAQAQAQSQVQVHEDEQGSEEEDENENDDYAPEDLDVAAGATEGTDQEMQDAGQGQGQQEDLADELETAKARLQARLQTEQADESSSAGDQPAESDDLPMQTRAMLDMIITVVGEYYGQKDLLQARETWQDSA